MRFCKPTVRRVEELLFCSFIVFFLSMNNVRSLFLVVEFVFIIVFVIHFFRRPYKICFLFVWSVLWLSICFLSIFFASVQRLTGCIAVAQMVIVVNLVYPLMYEDEKYFRLFLNCYWAAAALMLARQLVASGFEPSAWARLGGDFGYNANYVGIIGAYAGILSGLNFFFFRKKYGLLQLASALVIVFLSGSRTSLALLAIGLAFEFLCEILMNRNWLKKLSIIVLCIIIACIMLWLCFNVPLFYAMLGSRIEGFISTLLGGPVEASTDIRINMMSEGMSVFSKHPIIGVGIDNSGFYSIYGTYFHNNYVEILADTGLIGFTVYYSFWFVMAIYAIRSFRRLGKTNTLRRMLFCSIGLIMASLVGDIGRVSYYSENSLMVFPVLFYMLQCCMGRIKLKSIEKERANEPESILAET